jgi:hypothetical protein
MPPSVIMEKLAAGALAELVRMAADFGLTKR